MAGIKLRDPVVHKNWGHWCPNTTLGHHNRIPCLCLRCAPRELQSHLMKRSSPVYRQQKGDIIFISVREYFDIYFKLPLRDRCIFDDFIRKKNIRVHMDDILTLLLKSLIARVAWFGCPLMIGLLKSTPMLVLMIKQ